jgi:hypothetical protein
MKNKIRALVVGIIVGVASLAYTPTVAFAGSRCGQYHGRDYIICKESGENSLPYGLPAGTPHHGPSSASGPCGMLAAARSKYGGDSLDACTRYMLDRYGSWERAERHHRHRNWW